MGAKIIHVLLDKIFQSLKGEIQGMEYFQVFFELNEITFHYAGAVWSLTLRRTDSD